MRTANDTDDPAVMDGSPLKRWSAALAAFFVVGACVGAHPLAGWSQGGQAGSWRHGCTSWLAAWDGALGNLGAQRVVTAMAHATAAWTASIAASRGVDADLVADAAAQTALAADAAHDGVPAQPPAAAPPPTGPVADGNDQADAAAAPADDKQGDGKGGAKAKVVLLVGDSLMSVGLAQGIMLQLKDDPRWQVVRASRSATGLSRPDYFDWQGAIRKLVAQHKPDYVVVAIGGNDAQGVTVDKKDIHVGTEAWDKLYRERVTTFATSATAGGARLLWVGIPIVRSKSFWKNLSHLNDLVKGCVSKLQGATFLDASPFLSDGDGKFAAYLKNDSGQQEAVRAGDGIHLTPQGGRRVAKGVQQWLSAQK